MIGSSVGPGEQPLRNLPADFLPVEQISQGTNPVIVFSAFMEMASQAYKGKLLRGPFWNAIQEALQPIDESLKGSDPSLSLAHLATFTYYTPEMKDHLSSIRRV